MRTLTLLSVMIGMHNRANPKPAITCTKAATPTARPTTISSAVVTSAESARSGLAACDPGGRWGRQRDKV